MIASRNFALVQGLRGIAAIWVVLFHAGVSGHVDGVKAYLPSWASYAIFDAGHNGVAIFFALSGFVIAHSIRDADVNLSYVGRFVLRRSIRLDPPYWAAIAFAVFMGWLSATLKHESFVFPSIGQVAVHLLYLPTLLHQPLINTVFWTLCYEVQFYLVLVVSVALAQRFGRWVYGTLFAVALLWGTRQIPQLTQGLFVDLWHCFFLGVLAYWSKGNRLALCALIGLWFALMASVPNDFTMIASLTAAGLWLAWETDTIYSLLQARWLQFLGTISYSLYLLHNPVTGAVGFLVRRYGVLSFSALTMIIAASIGSAWIFWLVVEQRSLDLARRVKAKAEPRVDRVITS